VSGNNKGDEPTAPMRDTGHGGMALLIIDMIADFTEDTRSNLANGAKRVAAAIIGLRERMDALDAPVIYVNDHFGEWHSDRAKLVEKAKANRPGPLRDIAPRASDYFIIKPQFSGFYSTNLPVLLPKLGISRLILTGVSTDMCVLFTAADAHMRDYRLWVPEDATASINAQRSRAALGIMRDGFDADSRPARAWDPAQFCGYRSDG
jgi:nicotinamidase-related amidase